MNDRTDQSQSELSLATYNIEKMLNTPPMMCSEPGREYIRKPQKKAGSLTNTA